MVFLFNGVLEFGMHGFDIESLIFHDLLDRDFETGIVLSKHDARDLLVDIAGCDLELGLVQFIRKLGPFVKLLVHSSEFLEWHFEHLGYLGIEVVDGPTSIILLEIVPCLLCRPIFVEIRKYGRGYHVA